MLNNEAFKQLAKRRSEYCTSIYVPSHPSETGKESRSFLNRMLSEVAATLVQKGMSDKAARKYLFNAYELLEDKRFWQHLSYSLAIFITEDVFETFKLPYETGPYYFVANRYYLRPLLPAVNGTERFYLLALSENQANLYEGDRHELRPVNAEAILPNDMKAALKMEDEERNVQMNRGTSAYEPSIYEEEEMGSDANLKQYKRYFYQVDMGINEILKGERAPLVLATPDHLAPIYKETSDYLDIAPVHISGKPEEQEESRMHQKAIAIINNFFDGRRTQRARAFEEYDKDDLASSSIFEILPRAHNGDVETLFVAKGQYSRGKYNEKTKAVELHKEQQKDSVDLIDLAATYAHLNGGRVYFLPQDNLPHSGTNVNAIYRSGS